MPQSPQDILSILLPGQSFLSLDQYEWDREQQTLKVQLHSSQTPAACPLCGQPSLRIHSHYERTLAHLPCIEYSLTAILHVSKFFCDNPDCPRRVFTERLPGIAAPWSRKTERLWQRLQKIALALGGAAGGRLARHLNLKVCGSTLLNAIQKLSLPPMETPKILGADDFALRKGQNYGTILVDLERRKPIALLPDRKAETLANWLRAHPGIAILSRDRAAAYRLGMTQGAPDAVQVADRFHLVENLGEALESILSGYTRELDKIGQHPASLLENTVVVPARVDTCQTQQEKKQARQNQRIQQQQQLKILQNEGWSQADMAVIVGVSIRTVQRFLKSPDFADIPPERSTLGKGGLDPYKQTILEYWNRGIKTAALLMSHLQELGYEGSLRTLQRYLKRLKVAQGVPSLRKNFPEHLPKVMDPQSPPLTPRQASFLILKRQEHRDADDKDRLAKICTQHPELKMSVTLAESFLALLRQRQPEGLVNWLNRALECSLQPLQSFAKGLLEDLAAVQASFTLEVSNGPVEGQNNRLKMLKRQMYGRAGLDLLSKRFILAT